MIGLEWFFLFEFFRLPCSRCFQLRTGNSNLVLLLCGSSGQNVDLRWYKWFHKTVIVSCSVPSQNGREFALQFRSWSCKHNRRISRWPECTFMLLGYQQRMSFVSSTIETYYWYLFWIYVFRFDGTEFISAASSNYPHFVTTLGKIDEGLVAISGSGGVVTNEVEIFSNGNWYNQPAFPVEKYFCYYSTATFENTLYVFGKLN